MESSVSLSNSGPFPSWRKCAESQILKVWWGSVRASSALGLGYSQRWMSRREVMTTVTSGAIVGRGGGSVLEQVLGRMPNYSSCHVALEIIGVLVGGFCSRSLLVHGRNRSSSAIFTAEVHGGER
jgi:hypothetical protein